MSSPPLVVKFRYNFPSMGFPVLQKKKKNISQDSVCLNYAMKIENLLNRVARNSYIMCY